MRKDRDAGDTGKEQYCLCDRWFDRPGKRGAEAVGLCAQLFKDDVSAPVDAGGAAGTGVSGVSDYQWRTIS